MKTTLNWYKREANSFNNIGQRRLYQKYKFEGLGKFTALCDILVTLDNCEINIQNKEEELEMVAFGLGFDEVEKLTDFLQDLLKFKLLVKTTKNSLSTPEIIESLAITMAEREKAYIRKYGERPTSNITASYPNSSPELEEGSPELSEGLTELSEVRPNFSQREREKREEKKREEGERENFALEIFTKDFLKEIKKVFKVEDEKIIFFQEEFIKINQLKGKKWKNSEDFKTHFVNTLKIEIEKEKKSPKKEKESIAIQNYDE